MTATKPRFERHEADVRRKALVEATIESLKRHGHEGLSVRRISAEAGVSIGLINHHFPNKNALVAEAYRHFNRSAHRRHPVVSRARGTFASRAAACVIQGYFLPTEPRSGCAGRVDRAVGAVSPLRRDPGRSR